MPMGGAASMPIAAPGWQHRGVKEPTMPDEPSSRANPAAPAQRARQSTGTQHTTLAAVDEQSTARIIVISQQSTSRRQWYQGMDGRYHCPVKDAQRLGLDDPRVSKDALRKALPARGEEGAPGRGRLRGVVPRRRGRARAPAGVPERARGRRAPRAAVPEQVPRQVGLRGPHYARPQPAARQPRQHADEAPVPPRRVRRPHGRVRRGRARRRRRRAPTATGTRSGAAGEHVSVA